MSKNEKYYVRVCRPRFEVATIEVTCQSHDEAELLARFEASGLPQNQWKLLAHDPQSYAPHVEECWSDNDMDANSDDEHPKWHLVREFMALEDRRPQRYLLLLGDPTTGEGEVVFEPWCCSDNPGLIEADLSGDWIGELSAVFVELGAGPDPSRNGSH